MHSILSLYAYKLIARKRLAFLLDVILKVAILLRFFCGAVLPFTPTGKGYFVYWQ